MASLRDPQPATPTTDAPASTVTPPTRVKRRGKGRRWLVLLVVLALAGGAGAYVFYSGEQKTQANVLTDRVSRGDIESLVTATGVVTPFKDVDVGAQVSGQLLRIPVEIGDQVKQGDLIAEIDPASIKTQIEIAEAELANLKAQLAGRQAQATLAARTLARQQALVKANGAAQAALDEAEAAEAGARADIDALNAQIRKQEAALKDAGISLGHTQIYAPMAGTVVDIAATEGQTLNANQTTPTIATLADLSTMTIEADVSEADVSRLKVGMPVYFTLLGAPDLRIDGTLRQVKPKPSTENNVVLYSALFDVPNAEGRLMIDMTAEVFFVEASARNVLTVPLTALSRDRNGKAEVTVATAGGGRETRTIETGLRDRLSVEVRSGLSEGDTVVIGQASERSGQQRRGGGMPRLF